MEYATQDTGITTVEKQQSARSDFLQWSSPTNRSHFISTTREYFQTTLSLLLASIPSMPVLQFCKSSRAFTVVFAIFARNLFHEFYTLFRAKSNQGWFQNSDSVFSSTLEQSHVAQSDLNNSPRTLHWTRESNNEIRTWMPTPRAATWNTLFPLLIP